MNSYHERKPENQCRSISYIMIELEESVDHMSRSEDVVRPNSQSPANATLAAAKRSRVIFATQIIILYYWRPSSCLDISAERNSFFLYFSLTPLTSPISSKAVWLSVLLSVHMVSLQQFSE